MKNLTSNKFFWPVMYLISILLGNLFVIWFGIISITMQPFPEGNTIATLMFPAGVIFVGLTFSFRDFVQRKWGDYACWFWMIVATGITFFLNQKVALASVSAFAISEAIDWGLFKYLKVPLKKRIYISNLFSCPLDSIIFVSIAFGWFWPAIWGQALIKYLSGLLVIPFIKADPEIPEFVNNLDFILDKRIKDFSR